MDDFFSPDAEAAPAPQVYLSAEFAELNDAEPVMQEGFVLFEMK